MRTPAIIGIGRLANTGHLTITVHFFPGSESELSETIPGGSSVDLFVMIPLGRPGEVLSFTAQAESGPLYHINLYYTVETAGNQFYFTEVSPGGAGSPQPSRSATTPGKNIAMNLVCDGVVIVGTGDL